MVRIVRISKWEKNDKVYDITIDYHIGDRALCLNVIWISRIWIWIHIRKLENDTNGQSCIKSKC